MTNFGLLCKVEAGGQIRPAMLVQTSESDRVTTRFGRINRY